MSWRSWGSPRRPFFSVDLFAGGGGASEGIRDATGTPPGLAVNHCDHAIEVHIANHPETEHRCASVFYVDPVEACRGRRPDLLWASPDCTHFSRAKGGKPRSQKIRGLAWVVVRDPINEAGEAHPHPGWANTVRPRVIALENVPEFLTWGPLDDEGQPVKSRQGETFRRFVGALEALGYAVEWRALTACDYGAPTIRKRLFLVARCDGEPIVWPSPTHGPGRALPHRTAAECIDWSIPIPSIFDRSKPLAEATQRRIAEGMRRYVLECDEPYVVEAGGKALAPRLVSPRNGERDGQRPRARSVFDPFPTVTAKGSQGGLVAAFLAKHYTGAVGQDVRRPLGTVTATDHHSLVGVRLERHPSSHAGDVAAFLVKYYGNERDGQALTEPMHTVVAKDRFGLVTVHLGGEPYAVVDIGMRMLQPRELATAQGFGPEYLLTGTKTQQTARVGNSVCPPVARAIVAAQFPALVEVAA